MASCLVISILYKNWQEIDRLWSISDHENNNIHVPNFLEYKYHFLVISIQQRIMNKQTGTDPGFDQGGGPDRDRPKTAILGPQFWCWGLIFGGQGGGGPGPPGPPPWICP